MQQRQQRTTIAQIKITHHTHAAVALSDAIFCVAVAEGESESEGEGESEGVAVKWQTGTPLMLQIESSSLQQDQ